jgi:hypothetical protein
LISRQFVALRATTWYATFHGERVISVVHQPTTHTRQPTDDPGLRRHSGKWCSNRSGGPQRAGLGPGTGGSTGRHDPSSALTLVLLRRIDGELSDDSVLLIEDAHLWPGHHQDHPTAFVGASDAEMDEATAVAQGDLSRGVDLFMADPVALHKTPGFGGSALMRASKASRGICRPMAGRRRALL